MILEVLKEVVQGYSGPLQHISRCSVTNQPHPPTRVPCLLPSILSSPPLPSAAGGALAAGGCSAPSAGGAEGADENTKAGQTSKSTNNTAVHAVDYQVWVSLRWITPTMASVRCRGVTSEIRIQIHSRAPARTACDRSPPLLIKTFTMTQTSFIFVRRLSTDKPTFGQALGLFLPILRPLECELAPSLSVPLSWAVYSSTSF